jgi:hypothetical protein
MDAQLLTTIQHILDDRICRTPRKEHQTAPLPPVLDLTPFLAGLTPLPPLSAVTRNLNFPKYDEDSIAYGAVLPNDAQFALLQLAPAPLVVRHDPNIVFRREIGYQQGPVFPSAPVNVQHVPGSIVQDGVVRSPTVDEYLLFLCAMRTLTTEKVRPRALHASYGSSWTFYSPELLPLVAQLPEWLERQNAALQAVDARIIAAAPAYVVHGAQTLADGLHTVLVRLPPIDGYETRTYACLYAGPAYLCQTTIGDHALPGIVAADADGVFVSSTWCQRLAPEGPFRGQQFTHLNQTSLVTWLAGPGTAKAEGLHESHLFGRTPLPEHHADEGFAALVRAVWAVRRQHDNAGTYAWHSIPGVHALAQALRTAQPEAQPYVVWTSHNGFALAPVGKGGIARHDRIVQLPFLDERGPAYDIDAVQALVRAIPRFRFANERRCFVSNDPALAAYWHYARNIRLHLREQGLDGPDLEL